CMKTLEIGLETFAGAFSFLTCFEAVPYAPSALIITPCAPGFLANLPGIPDKPIFLAWVRRPSRRCSRVVFRKERQNLCRTVGVIHHVGFTDGPQEMFEVLVPIFHSCLRHLCTAGISDGAVPRLLGLCIRLLVHHVVADIK